MSVTDPPLIASMGKGQREAARTLILDGRCPWCADRKQWASIGIHLAKKHGMSAVDVRDALSIPPWVALCSAAVSESAADRIRDWQPWENARGKQVSGPHRTTSWTREAKAAANKQRSDDYQKGREPRHGTPHEYRRYGCRCAQCKKAHSTEVMRVRNQKRRRESDGI